MHDSPGGCYTEAAMRPLDRLTLSALLPKMRSMGKGLPMN